MPFHVFSIMMVYSAFLHPDLLHYALLDTTVILAGMVSFATDATILIRSFPEAMF